MGEYSELEDPVAVILTLQRYREKLSSQVGSSPIQAFACWQLVCCYDQCCATVPLSSGPLCDVGFITR